MHTLAFRPKEAVAEKKQLVWEGVAEGRLLGVVRGLAYYTGPVFEAELTAPIKDEKGQPIRLGSVVSGVARTT